MRESGQPLAGGMSEETVRAAGCGGTEIPRGSISQEETARAAGCGGSEDKRTGKVRMLDMHAHLLCLSGERQGERTEQDMLELGVRELAMREKHAVDTVFSCGTPPEWEFMRKCLAGRRIKRETEKETEPDGLSESAVLSFGIHPWHSDRFRPQDCRELFRECPMIGEIGMDSVWCDVPLALQRNVFAQQLEIAAELGKPIVLHTKGQEAQIAEMLRGFPGKVCVHWYSGEERSFEKFLEADCYFTLGPDLAEKWGSAASDQSAALYRRMLREIPADRLFLETDGASSIAWMRGQEEDEASVEEIPDVLGRNLECASREKQMQPEELQICMWENFRRFIS